jgi:PEP-CTERM motif
MEAYRMRRNSLAAALLAATILSTGPVWAGAIVRTSADAGNGLPSSSINSSNLPGLVNEPHVSSLSHASELSASSEAAAGTVNTCFNGGSNCHLVGTDRYVNSFASANGNNGTLRAGVHTYVDNSLGGGFTRGTATATLTDTITLTSPVIKISIDVTKFLTNDTGGKASFLFAMGFTDPTPENLEDQGATPLFTLEGIRDEGGPQLEQGFIAYLLGEPENVYDSGSSVPGFFSLEIDLSDPAFAALFEPLFPDAPPPFNQPAFDLDGPNEWFFTLTAEAYCDHDPCSATSRLEETLYVELEGQSANGYNYPGRQIVDPPNEIPEPATGAMLLGGLAALAAGLRRRRG